MPSSRSSPTLASVFVRRRDGETITAKERRELIILAAADELTITWSRYAAGERGLGLHVHREHTDAFYVLEGELTFEVGSRGDRIRAGAGGFVAVPPNVVHTFASDGQAESRWLNFHAPDMGFAAYLRDARDGLAAAWDSCDPPADGGRRASEVIVVAPGEDEALAADDRAVALKGALTDLRVAEWLLDGPYHGAEPPRDGQVDAYYVLEGELDVGVEGAERRTGPGTLVSIPPGTPHTVAHRRRARTRVLHVLAPASVPD
jgi:quercetin dioxygenase-like cupin family protein